MWFYGCLDTLSIPSPRIMLKNSEGEIFSVEVIPETVGQFIGLYDIKDNEIYDGDIICSFDSKGNKILHIVKYEERDAAFITFLVMDNGVLSRTGGIYSGWIAEFGKEVIGNIYDNKELLKTQN